MWRDDRVSRREKLPLIERLERFESRRLKRATKRSASGSQEVTDAALSDVLLEEIDGAIDRVSWLRERRRAFRELSRHASSDEDRRKVVLKAARELGSKGRQLWLDARAQSRWFDDVALVERFDRAIGESQQRLTFLFRELAATSVAQLESVGHAAQLEAFRELNFERRFAPLLEGDWDDRVAVAILEFVRDSIEALAVADRRRALSSGFRQSLVRMAQDRRQTVWRQTAALDLLALVEREPLRIILQQKLASVGGGDDFFVREHAVHLIGRLLLDGEEPQELYPLLGLAAADPSPFVRQATTRQLGGLPIDIAADYWLDLARDSDREVRGAAFDAVPLLAENHDLALWILSCVQRVLPLESDPVIVRVGIEGLVDAYERLSPAPALAEEWLRDSLEVLDSIRIESGSTAVRRWAASARERLWAAADPLVRSLLVRLAEPGVLPRPGRTKRLPTSFFAGLDVAGIGRGLAVAAQDDFPLELEPCRGGYKLTRGFRFRYRFWRALHELRNPAPDKRQGYRHTIGRVHYGSIRAPSERLSELAETKVPGEPLYVADEDGWRPYIPLLDDALSTLNQPLPGRAIRFFTSQGVTVVTPPRGLGQRLRAWWRIGVDFAKIARLRNWQSGSSNPPTSYVQALEDLGFSIEMERHAGRESAAADPSVHRFFPAVAAMPPAEWWAAFLDYSLSLYENTLFDLALFVGLLTLFFLGRHIWANLTLRGARENLGLVIGGWGTRGKSSVERLKAGLLNGLGHGLVSKTTGCEAMILYAPAFGTLRELFLFRPYDKATIWEQANVTRIASGLGSDVLLWECMGLTPAYVDILQRQWMRDDLSTLTNTYPDHEDLQGPAGINIPMVMTLFIPTAGRLLASEEQMLPILTESARSKNTSMASVGWKEAALVPRDILARFPYEEHPYNIALVSRLAEELGVSRAFALKEMADRVVPDLGVLKTYPVARVDGRELEFSNGMSANERHGCLSNWNRLGLAEYDAKARGQWTTTVVNNRADRIPRSRVFAEILVADLSADRHFLIGGNLDGLRGYLDEAWSRWVETVDPWSSTDGRAPIDKFDELVARFRQPIDDESLSNRLSAMLGEHATVERVEQFTRRIAEGQSVGSLLSEWGIEEALHDAIERAARDETEALGEVDRLRRLVEEGGGDAALAEVRRTFRSWFDRKIVVVEDYYATGNEIVERIAHETPPGFRNHIVGIQNIKGTGLDFVYRWLDWERCFRSCQKVLTGDTKAATEGVDELNALREFGPLCREEVRRAIASARENARALGGQLAELDSVERAVEGAVEGSATGPTEEAKRGVLARVALACVGYLEDILDAGDAIRRRKKADQIFRDLVGQRISTERAIGLLQDLTKRQKGGWLIAQLRARPLLKRVFR